MHHDLWVANARPTPFTPASRGELGPFRSSAQAPMFDVGVRCLCHAAWVSADPAAAPSGVVTFLFTDVEGSTRRWENDADGMRKALAAHDEVLRAAIEAHDGFLFSHTGDGVVAAFASPRSAVDAAVAAQRVLAGADGAGDRRGRTCTRDYFGTVLNRAARVMAAGHGRQILVADSKAAQLTGVDLLDLGPRRLVMSGARDDRPGLAALMEYVREGDTVVVWKLDRLGRNMLHILQTVKELTDRGVTLVSTTDGIDSSTPAGRMMIGVLGSLAEYERELIKERTALKRAASRANGTKFGRPRKVADADHITTAKRMKADGHTGRDIAKYLGVSRATLYRYLVDPAA